VHLASIWRYPVKSMRGERLERASLARSGLAGDRVVQVYAADGRVVTARTHPALLGHQATIGPDGEPRIDGHPWASPAARAIVAAAAGPGATLARREEHRFDILPLLVATDGALEAFGRDPRRLRPNLVIGGVDGLEERRWEARRIRVGPAVIEIDDLRSRCVMTTFDPDTLEQDPGVLRDIVRRFDGRLCLNARIVEPGEIADGLPVQFL
jgi:uncharacterized protein YcbX